MPANRVTVEYPPQLDPADLRQYRTYRQRKAMFDQMYPAYSDPVEFERLIKSEMKLMYPDDNKDYVDFGTVIIGADDIFLNNLSGQKLGNWAEYLFQHVVKIGPNRNSATYGESKPLVEGAGVDGTYVTDENLKWTRYGLVQGRVYEIKSTSSENENHKYVFKQDNVKALTQTDGFYIMCRSQANWDGKGNSIFEYRGLTSKMVMENYAGLIQSKILAASLTLYGVNPEDPSIPLPDNIHVYVRQPGEPNRLIHASHKKRKTR